MNSNGEYPTEGLTTTRACRKLRKILNKHMRSLTSHPVTIKKIEQSSERLYVTFDAEAVYDKLHLIDGWSSFALEHFDEGSTEQGVEIGAILGLQIEQAMADTLGYEPFDGKHFFTEDEGLLMLTDSPDGTVSIVAVSGDDAHEDLPEYAFKYSPEMAVLMAGKLMELATLAREQRRVLELKQKQEGE